MYSKSCMLLDLAHLQPSSRKDGQWHSLVAMLSVSLKPGQGKPSHTASQPSFISMLNLFLRKETVPLSSFSPLLENLLSKFSKNAQNSEGHLGFVTHVSTVEFHE